MKILEYNATLEVPREVGVCPYCSASIQVQITGAEQQEDGSWAPDCCDVTCTEEPADIMDDEWDDWSEFHCDMPYVYWMPVENKVEAWLQANYRIQPH